MNKKALDHLLKKELLSNLKELHFSHAGRTHPCNVLLEEARHAVIGNCTDHSTISRKDISGFLNFYLNTMRESLSWVFVEAALTSGAYLTHNEADDTYESNEMSDALLIIKKSFDGIERVRRTMQNNQTLAMLIQATNQPQFMVENTRMAPLLNLYNCVKNVIAYSTGLARALEGDLQTLRGLTPMQLDALQRDGQLTFDRPKPSELDEVIKGRR